MKFFYVFSIVLIVASNIVYNICQKSTSPNINPFIALLATYLIASIIAFIAFFFNRTGKGLLDSIKELNWTSVALGVSIVGVEFGYLAAYRAGWNISVGSLVANIILALMLIPIGIIFFKEKFRSIKILGVSLCLVGLILLNLR